MRQIFPLILVLWCVGLWAVSHKATAITLNEIQHSIQTVNHQITQATVALVSDSGNMGTGVIVNAQGLILTASHVVGAEETMTVIFADGSTKQARVLGANFTRDAAMVQIADNTKTYPFVSLGQSDSLKVGDFVIALGHAKGYDAMRRAPIRLGRMRTDGKQRFILSECTLIGGDSGGPLFDLQGRLVGIHSSIGPTIKINNHVPISVFVQDWQALLKGEQWGQLGLHPMADPESPVMGFEMAEAFALDGVLVQDVIINSPADQAGLQRGDVLLSMNDRQLRSVRDMIRELGRYRPGETVSLVVQRQSVTYQAQLTFAKRGRLFTPPQR